MRFPKGIPKDMIGTKWEVLTQKILMTSTGSGKPK